MARVFYRIVKSDPPTLIDFMSPEARGRVPRHPTVEVLRLWDGISAYETEEQARAKARELPRLGRYIAAVLVPEDGPIRHERTLDSEGHWTLWGEPAELLRRVTSVVRV